jgi:hypothetical protein
MRKVFEWLDNRRFPGDWAIADMIKQYLRGRRKQITKREKLTSEAEAKKLAKERRRRQEILEKRVVLGEDDPESLAMEAANEDITDDKVLDADVNWPPARSNKKRRHVSPAKDSDEESSD